MGSTGSSYHVCTLLMLVAVWVAVSGRVGSTLLPESHYDGVCRRAMPTIRRLVRAVVRHEPRMGGSLLRLHFHDCFVNGCDASVLLDESPTIESEKTARPNNNSLRGFEVIDAIKAVVDRVCKAPVVSCADILAVAARDSVVALGGVGWAVELGRKDSTTASRTDANNNLPSPLMDLPALIRNFEAHDLDVKDLVALSGGHTLGFSQCFAFRKRIYNESINPFFTRIFQKNCPPSGGNSNLAPLDSTPGFFDLNYFKNLLVNGGLLHSDQALFEGGGQTDDLVKTYSFDFKAFNDDFGASMIKMGKFKTLTGNLGQIRRDCRKVNVN